ncbi:hypothetical protein SUGI_0885430 [Cryptomeria japonica]|nr:hypothetical protein SUGI_0885430 [Cryptomeria japonica]
MGFFPAELHLKQCMILQHEDSCFAAEAAKVEEPEQEKVMNIGWKEEIRHQTQIKIQSTAGQLGVVKMNVIIRFLPQIRRWQNIMK